MTQKARQSQSSSKAAVHPVVLFGVDRHGKPTAARFPEGQARLAAKAAEQLDLRVPVGRIHASGKGFVPNVRGDLYAKLLAMAGPPAPVTRSSALTPRGTPSNGGKANTKTQVRGNHCRTELRLRSVAGDPPSTAKPRAPYPNPK